MIVQEALRHAVLSLRALGIPDARLEGELLLMHSLGWERVRLYSHRDAAIPQEREEAFASNLQRRLQREPLPYILGSREFYGLEFYVDSRVFIPRPETELLVEEALAFARKLAPTERDSIRMADIGTGSGAIAVALAVNLPHVSIYATDLSPDALQVAALNAQRHGVSHRVLLLQGDLLEPLPAPVDIIVANLPYIPDAVLGSLPPEISLGEPPLALLGGESGTEVISRLLLQAQGRIRSPGLLLLEFGDDQSAAHLRLAEERLPEASAGVIKDLAGLDRLLRVELPQV